VPTYQYACTECGHQLEAVQSFSDDPLTQCPTCTGRLRKLFGSVGIVFKGSGFYRTDSRAGAEAAAGGTGGAAKDGAESTANGAKKDGTKNDGAKKDGTAKDGSGSGEKPTPKKEPAAATAATTP
jgi:putative FmdB family regulatory protein